MGTLLHVAAVAAGALVAGVLAATGVASCCEKKMSVDAFYLVVFAGAALAACVLWGRGPKDPSRFPRGAWIGCVFLTSVAIWMSVRLSRVEARMREAHGRAKESPEWIGREMAIAEGVEVGDAIHFAAWVLAAISIANVVSMTTRRREVRQSDAS